MPRLPSAEDLGGRPTPRASRGVAQYQPTSGQEGSVARAITGAGADIFQAGQVIQQTNERNDNIAAEDAYNRLQMEQDRLANDPTDGFLNKKGVNAVGQDFNDSEIKRFNTAADSVEASLKNENQREMFQRRRQIAEGKQRSALLRHQSSETDSFYTGTENATIELEAKNIAESPLDENSVNASKARINATIDAQAERQGWSPEQKENQKRSVMAKVNKLVEGETLIGVAQRETDRVLALDITNAEKMQLVYDELKDNPKLRDEVSSRMMARIKQDDALEDLEEEERQQVWDDNEATITVDLLNGALTQERLIEMVNNDELSPSVGKAYAKALKDGGVQSDDQNTLLEYTMRGIENITDDEIVRDPSLTLETKRKLISEKQGIIEDQSNWRNSQQAQEGARRIDQEFGIMSGMLQNLDPEAAKLAGRLKTEWYEMVDGLPAEQRATKAKEFADVIISKKKVYQAESNIERQEIKLETMEFSTEKELDDAIKAGDERLVSSMFGVSTGEKTSEINAHRNMILRRNKIIERNRMVIQESRNATR